MTRSTATAQHRWGCELNASAIIRGGFYRLVLRSPEKWCWYAAAREKKGTAAEVGTGRTVLIRSVSHRKGRILEMPTETGRDALYGGEKEAQRERGREREVTHLGHGDVMATRL